MIKENQQLLNRLNVLSDGLIIYLMIPVAFWLRFSVLPDGKVTVSLSYYLLTGVFFMLIQLYIFLAAGLYKPFRHIPLTRELERLLAACLLGFILLLSWFSLQHQDDYSRQMILIYFLLCLVLLGGKRVVLRLVLRHYRSRGFNLKHVVLIGCGPLAEEYLNKITEDKRMGFHPLGYIASEKREDWELRYLGGFEDLEAVLEKRKPDEVVSAIQAEDYERTGKIVQACEKTGCKLSIIPLYTEYMSAHPQFDDLDGIPLLNVRRIPLDNFANAFVKRAMDVVLSALILVIFSPLLLFCAIGVRISSPGPIIFKQERIGRNKKPFMMYKFRSMRVNDRQDTAWSSRTDSRKTAFGSFIRKYSLDEFPQFWNVLKGDMSMVGPRPEIPFYVDQFKEEVPRYMLKHLVRPGITGWAQVNDLRGDTSIPERIRYDIWYIENWSIALDVKILFLTVFGGKFKNDEKLNKTTGKDSK
ncbi:MAG: undecaprenyl-phosphate glucose phosphotransferase [Oscillospiraceae bacterium]|nr:undecaprenyl-phosphate glucose phosphotransferase [Oscillospiraceae bacterium]